MNMIEYWFHLIAYEIVVIICFLPIVAVLFGVLKLFEYWELRGLVTVVRVILGLGFLTWILVSSYLARKSALYRINGQTGFLDALRDSWAETKGEAACLPVVGRWISSKSDK